MDDIKRINDQLMAYPKLIYDASLKTEDLREVWALADARLEYEKAKAYLVAKADDLTEGQTKSRAIEEAYDTSIAVLRLESSYRRALADQLRIENQFTAIRKQANLLEMSNANSGRFS